MFYGVAMFPTKDALAHSLTTAALPAALTDLARPAALLRPEAVSIRRCEGHPIVWLGASDRAYGGHLALRLGASDTRRPIPTDSR